MQTLIVEIRGGVIQELYTDAEDLRIVKVDWDAGESPGDAVQVGDLTAQSFSALPVETREAIAVFAK